MHSDACELFMSEFPELFFPAPVLIKSGKGSVGFLSYWSHSRRHTKTSELQSTETTLEFYWRRIRVCLKRREGQTWLCWRVISTQITGFRMFFPSRQWCRTVCAGPLQTAERTNNTSGLKFTGLSLITGTRAASLLQKVRRRLTWRSPKWSSKRIFVFRLRPLRLMPNFDRSTVWYL